LFTGAAESAPGPAVQVTAGESAPSPQPFALGTAVTRRGRQLVLWFAAAADGENARLWGRMVDPARGVTVGEEFAVSGLGPDGAPVAATTGDAAARGRRDEFLVTWAEENDDGFGVRLLARRFSDEGSALGEPLVVASEPRFLEVSGGAIAYGGPRRGFVVVFRARDQAGYAIYAARVAAGNTRVSEVRRISPYRKTLLESPGSYSVAYDSTTHRFLATWEDLTGELTFKADRDVYARTIAGAPSRKLGRTRRISPPATSGRMSLNPDVAYNPAKHESAVSWTSRPGSESSRIYARRIGPRGGPSGRAASIDGDDAAFARISAARGGQYLVTFSRAGPREDDQTVLARRVGASLKARPPRSIPTEGAVRGDNGGIAYSLASNRFVVTWAETSEKRLEGSPCCPRYGIFTRTL